MLDRDAFLRGEGRWIARWGSGARRDDVEPDASQRIAARGSTFASYRVALRPILGVMRGRLVTLVVVAGCYAPKVQTGAPCDPALGDSGCPIGQHCLAEASGHFCDVSAPGDAVAAIDASLVDVSPTLDTDGDGIPDVSDNCPTVPNPLQENEDGDRFGDVCDPCPPIADDDPMDSDGDGIADACDPHPLVAGDHLTLFEGFHHGVPMSWTVTGTWTASGDDVSVVAGPDKTATLLPPVQATANMTVTAGMIIDSIALATDDTDVGVVLPYTSGAVEAGIDCYLGQPAGGALDLVILDLAGEQTVVNKTADTWAFNTPYIVAMVRGSTTTCATTAGNLQVTGTPAAGQPSPGLVGFRVHSATARAQWLMIVTSPGS